jgi:single-strand DNA-binding protein
MANLNKVFLAGNLTRNPEVKYVSTGQAVAELDIAINNVYLTKTGEKKEDTVFVHVVAWGRQAETAGQYLSKGSPILVEGRLQLDSWETPEGEKRSRLKVQAQRIQFLGSPGGKKEGAAETAKQSEKISGDENGGVRSPMMPMMEAEEVAIVDDEIPF